jgi:hypothetical protein
MRFYVFRFFENILFYALQIIACKTLMFRLFS